MLRTLSYAHIADGGYSSSEAERVGIQMKELAEFANDDEALYYSCTALRSNFIGRGKFSEAEKYARETVRLAETLSAYNE